MIQSLTRWGTKVALTTAAIIGAWSATHLSALALTEQQVSEILGPVLVFTITDIGGAPLVVSVPIDEAGTTTEVAGAFMSQADAVAFAERLTTESPDLVDQIQITLTSLAEIYELDFRNEDNPDDIDFIYIPTVAQTDNAQPLLAPDQTLSGVPLFVARTDQGGYLTIEHNGAVSVPFFFDYEQAQGLLNQFQSDNPTADVVVEVVPLAGMLNTLRTGESEGLENIVLVPSREGLSLLQQLQEQQQQ